MFTTARPEAVNKMRDDRFERARTNRHFTTHLLFDFFADVYVLGRPLKPPHATLFCTSVLRDTALFLPDVDCRLKEAFQTTTHETGVDCKEAV